MRNLAEALAEELRLSVRPNITATGATREEVDRLAESLAALAFSHLLDHPLELVVQGVIEETELWQVPDVDALDVAEAAHAVASAVDPEDRFTAEGELAAMIAAYQRKTSGERPGVYGDLEYVPACAPALYRFTR